jgi:hypothetical protein
LGLLLKNPLLLQPPLLCVLLVVLLRAPPVPPCCCAPPNTPAGDTQATNDSHTVNQSDLFKSAVVVAGSMNTQLPALVIHDDKES